MIAPIDGSFSHKSEFHDRNLPRISIGILKGSSSKAQGAALGTAGRVAISPERAAQAASGLNHLIGRN